ncbi:MAG: GCN5-related N-acetyltransferase [Gemmatimonadetes bacterium]|nr:GCN5-related N-acetyltransferase [Gemmatimonadota bacterium]
MSAGVPPEITTRRATPSDAALLAELGASTFSDTFAAENTHEDIAAYLSDAFGEEQQRAELEDPDVTVFFAERAGEVVGYVMLREGPAPPMVRGFDVLEIARFYARQHAKGTGVGPVLMQRVIHEAAARGKEALWLGVWEKNARAIAFYGRWDFFEAGTQPFKLGDDEQVDLVMVRRIARES